MFIKEMGWESMGLIYEFRIQTGGWVLRARQ
jgi:hypothetical protein